MSFTAAAGQGVYFNLTHGDSTLNSASISLVGPNRPVPLPRLTASYTTRRI